MNIKLKKWLQNDATSGIVLILAAALAMFLANYAGTQQAYQNLLAIPVEFRLGSLDISKNLLLWINDALMAIFFLMVGLEVKREMVMGALAKREQAVFPLIAALGGRVPPALKIFLMALAIIDDLGAIVIIALFYTSDLSMTALGVAAMAIVALAAMNLLNARNTGLYLLVGMVLWTAVLKSGVHATLAGVVVGFLIPLKKQGGHSPAIHLEHALHPWVRWLILPLFAFANAGVSLDGIHAGDIFSLLPLGIVAGLLFGKPLGITLFCWLAVKFRLASLPQNTRLADIAAVGVLCGIGFTMSIFIASLAYGESNPQLITLAKLGILLGSILSAVAGYVILGRRLRHRTEA